MLPRPLGLLVSPEYLKGFLQIPGTHQWRVPADQRGETLVLVVAEIPRILQQQPTGSFDGHSVFGSELAPQLAPHRVHRLVEMLDDVKPIKQELCLRRV